MATARIFTQRLLGLSRFPTGLQTRSSSYESSQFTEDVPQLAIKYETVKSEKDWQYVERILPPLLVPEPPKKDNYPSGWQPQADHFDGKEYYIARTKNHMMPVFLHVKQRGVKRETVITKIHGNIWKLEAELRPFIAEQLAPKPTRIHVNEFARKIVINGDFVNAVKYWLGERSL